MAESDATGRRAYDDPAGLVVPLREYLEGMINASHDGLATEIAHLRAEMADTKAQASREHAEVRTDLAKVAIAVTSLTATAERKRGADALWKTIAATIAALATLTGIAAFAVAVLP